MKQDDTTARFDEQLLVAYFSGTTTAEEEQALLAWIRSSDDNRRTFAELRAVWQRGRMQRPDTQLQARFVRSLNSLNRRIDALGADAPLRRSRRIPLRRFAAAAIVAVALAAALHADELIIYTDVDGIYSADPRLCPDALRRERISYDDMLLLAQKGAQVLHERSVALAQQYAVPIAVRSCGEKSAGSLVCEAGEESPVTGVTQQKSGKGPLASISAVGRALPASAYKKKVVSALEGGGVRVCAVVTGERLMSVFVPREDAERALRLAHSALIEGKKT